MVLQGGELRRLGMTWIPNPLLRHYQLAEVSNLVRIGTRVPVIKPWWGVGPRD